MTKRNMTLLSLWLLLCIGGSLLMAAYANMPGEPTLAPGHWPAASRVAHDDRKLTLVMLVHPQCPCSDASVGELERILAKTAGTLNAVVFFYHPASEPETWAHSVLWRRAQDIPGAHVLIDRDGTEAARFGARTSGAVTLYDRKGMLVFSGGITPSRGHAGDNAGKDAIIDWANGQATALHTSPVFGCHLRGGASK